MQTKGKWIVIEGIDGAGKTTAMALICSIFDSLSIDYLSLREPGGTLLGEAIRNILKQADYQTFMQPFTETATLFANGYLDKKRNFLNDELANLKKNNEQLLDQLDIQKKEFKLIFLKHQITIL
jgi:thymidylate kinase